MANVFPSRKLMPACYSVANDLLPKRSLESWRRIWRPPWTVCIFEDPRELTDWELSQAARLWVHLCDAAQWCGITGKRPPQEPFTAKEYSAHGLPWFDYYNDDMEALKGSSVLSKLKTVLALASEQGDTTVPQEGPVMPEPVITLGPTAPKDKVSEWSREWTVPTSVNL